ncbi:GDP-L-fucose synthase [Candidatus Pacearchaeota archaeon]|nr:GDP-L-fucose synthase [Candidatus Pacearchaeota archaeon]
MQKNSGIYVAGHKGLVGSAILRKLKQKGYENIITKSHKELDLTKQEEVEEFFEKQKPEYVFLAAAKVGGILANRDYPADFIYQNLMIACNVINASYKNNIKKLINLGSTCIYPRDAPQPLKEDSLLSGKLEKTNEAYAIAKIATIKLCKYYNKQYNTNFISVMPTNLYGENDNFDLKTSHVVPALIRKFHEAKQQGKQEVEIWGSGKPLREFMYVDDLADALIFIMENKNSSEIGEFVNIGTGKEISIRDFANLIGEIVGFKGELKFDFAKPDGTPRKVTDISKLKELGWFPKTSLRDGLEKTYNWFKENY